MSRKKIDHWLMNAVSAHKQGDLEGALCEYNKVLSVDPKNADALHLTGLVAYQKENLKQAHDLVNRAIKLKSQVAVFWNTKGLIMRAQGDSVDAVKCYQRAINLEPHFAESHMNLGVAWQLLGEPDNAANCYKKALEINPQSTNAIKNLAQLLISQKFFVEAANLLRVAMEINPDDNEAFGSYVFANQHLCRWDDIKTQQDRINQLIEVGINAFITPFSHLSMTTSPEIQLNCSKAWSQRVMPPLERTACHQDFTLTHKANDKIKIAYWSSDLQEHATSYLIADVIECHDRKQFEITLLSYGTDNGSSMRERLIAAADDFIDIRESSYETVVKLIQNKGIDILVDLKGYTSDTRSPMLALRAAPIQVNWLGYPGSLGTKHADYIIADDFVIPPGMERYYSEKVMRLPSCYQPNDRHRPIGETLSRQAYSLPESGFVFCSFNQAYKILPEMFDTWMCIMKRVPNSVLWLLSANADVEENLRKEAKRREVQPERLIFAKQLPLAQHLARYRIADLALDTYPYGSHTTASDALWVGCPLIALVGNTFASRVSGSILRAAGIPELITVDTKSFENLAVSLALNPQKLLSLKQLLSAARDKIPLFDTPAFTLNLESAYRDMLADKSFTT